MNTLKYLSVIIALLLIATAGLAQEQPMKQEHMMAQHGQMSMMERHEHMMAVMRDSTMMHMMMDSIATNHHMRTMMLQKMMQHVKSDTLRMMHMSRTMLQDKDMRSMMRRMMRGKPQMSERDNPDLIVKYKKQAKAVDIKQMESQIGLTKVKEVPELNMHFYKIQSKKSVDEAIEACQKESFVEYAEPNKKYKAQKK
ncbi:hypothetical protein GWO43_28715 [candidate division KSB1 bacterium]|nr:hypothetical protein [candidate division KSB1 bacterium]NIR71078.1 hypothetical protein [candidate division KSB1 bacterium]NIS27888.1 hypothetical protein [candidate division KSB1 bacterium]NIT74771.1 hypothetical protein [candidate division KSB1 bacterium]NIU28548.1 hypothetical protein [candidate division KSB1 bacterium]